MYDYFNFVCSRKVATPLLDRSKTALEIFLKDKLMTLALLYVEICAREDVPVYCNKGTSIDMQNDAVARVNLEQSRIQSLSSHENDSHHTLTPVLLQMINTSGLKSNGNKC